MLVVLTRTERCYRQKMAMQACAAHAAGIAIFEMVDAVFAPLFRYFGFIDPAITQTISQGLPRVTRWREALALRASVVAAVSQDYGQRFKQPLAAHWVLLAD